MKHALLLFMALLCLEISVNAQTELWSMAPVGGTDGNGAIYKISSDGTTYTPVYNFLVTSSQGSTPIVFGSGSRIRWQIIWYDFRRRELQTRRHL
ncbi:MAG: hypothetical protein IPH33_15930 [Bacteroidetes bacterium]|nr:hypothetical protein [Bacteroidota bacterium]